MNGNYTVYKHTLPNGKAYIGITSQRLVKRWQRGYGYTRNPLFYKAILKYGWENILHDILFTGLTKEEAEQKEIELIKQYDLTNTEKGYNLQYGGNVTGTKTERERLEISERQRGTKSRWFGKPAYNRGIPMSKEQKIKVSEARKGKGTGERNCNYKKEYTAEERERLGSYKRGKKESEETRKKKSEYHRTHPPANCKAVVCIDTGKEYNSRAEASRQTNTFSDSIRKCCNGERLTAGGYRWKWKEVKHMIKCIAIINQKGGVGKSTTAHCIGAGLTLKGFKVLYIDLDAQGNLTYTLGADPKGLTALDVLTKEATAAAAVQHTAQGDVIAASPSLAGADTVITSVGKEYRLKEALEPLKENYDYIIIDTPPALSVLTINALTACTGAIIPAQADIYSLQGISQLNSTIQTVRQYCNPSLEVMGIVLTRYSSRAILSREVAEMIEQTAERLNTKLYKTTIRENIAVKEAQASQQNIFEYAPKSNAASDYSALVDEIIERS